MKTKPILINLSPGQTIRVDCEGKGLTVTCNEHEGKEWLTVVADGN